MGWVSVRFGIRYGAVGKMRLSTAAIFATLACIQIGAWACEPGQAQNGCKIYRSSCTCGYGCRTEYIYKTRRACYNALKERSANVCSTMPCIRGICTQTSLHPGFVCKCEGTGFYGQLCDKACPTIPMRGVVFPHECVVI